ncbi:ABC transporter substrate-binding protein [Mechercharimyces sp. CAU 1602]|uniref:ABC transporter substrate-binding protein n=1 Tax=Mechercharimyces sp. CAU 1602 TaxID=2973933 RepID=UPI0021634A11|nr:ABC transporter substrate-binding protein [Mechercharimyces sp. CAU 1602]MCS1352651.1 ABC transporter substrate-binding protein [Mechercharimyces sp. CAU 1602]
MAKLIPYFQMRGYLYEREQGLKANFKFQELEQLWNCTGKNVKLRLKRLQEQEKIVYTPGRGRGNASTITFLRPLQVDLEHEVNQLIKMDHLDDVMKILQIPLPSPFSKQILEKVQDFLGFRTASNKKDVLRAIAYKDIYSIDPRYISTSFECFLIMHLGDPLVLYDSSTDTIKPHIAHAWKKDTEGVEWTFYLRKGVLFHHHRELVSEDIRFTFERFRDPTLPNHWIVKNIANIKCVSPYIITFRLHNPNHLFLRYLSWYVLVILPRDIPFAEDQFISTGPFRIKEKHEGKLSLEVFDRHFLPRPFLDEAHFYPLANERHFGMKYEIIENKNESYHTKITVGVRFIVFNFKKCSSIIHSPYFREAIYHLFDIEKMAQELKRDTITPASSYFATRSHYLPKDRDKVANLLKKSGYQGEEILFSYKIQTFEPDVTWFMKQAKEVGIQIRPMYSSTDNQTRDDQADLVMGRDVGSDDILSFLDWFYNQSLLSQRTGLVQHWKQIQCHLENIEFEVDEDKRTTSMNDLEAYIRANHLMLYLDHPIEHNMFNTLMKDVYLDRFGFLDMRKLWLDEKHHCQQGINQSFK